MVTVTELLFVELDVITRPMFNPAAISLWSGVQFKQRYVIEWRKKEFREASR